jgi:hypothetical protein
MARMIDVTGVCGVVLALARLIGVGIIRVSDGRYAHVHLRGPGSINADGLAAQA